MRSILEQVVSHLINENRDAAEELMHKFVIAKARQIHESLRQGDEDILAEGWDDEIMSENYFTEAELDDAVVDDGADVEDDLDADAAADDLSGDLGVEGEVADEAGEDAGFDPEADLGAEDADMDAEVEGDDLASIKDDIADMKDELAKLVAEFEQQLGGDAVGSDDDFGAEDSLDADADADGAEFDADTMAPADEEGEVEDDMGDDETVKESNLEEDFDDITESIVSELEKISVANSDGREQGGKSIQQNSVSGKFASGKAGAIKTKQDQHVGYSRETAPTSSDLKKYRNNNATSTTGRSKVSKEGEAKAELNHSKVTGTTKSPIAGK